MSAAAATLVGQRPTEFRFDAADHKAISAFVYDAAGILMPPNARRRSMR